MWMSEIGVQDVTLLKNQQNKQKKILNILNIYMSIFF